MLKSLAQVYLGFWAGSLLFSGTSGWPTPNWNILKTNMFTLEHGWLEDEISSWGPAYFQKICEFQGGQSSSQIGWSSPQLSFHATSHNSIHLDKAQHRLDFLSRITQNKGTWKITYLGPLQVEKKSSHRPSCWRSAGCPITKPRFFAPPPDLVICLYFWGNIFRCWVQSPQHIVHGLFWRHIL